MKENVWKKDSVIYLSCLLGLLCRSNWPISIDLKGFACHWRFVTRSQQLSSKSFLLPDIEIASFSLSRPLLQCFKRQASKANNLAKERAANVSCGVVEVRVTYKKCPSLDITVIIIIIDFFLRPKFFCGNHYNWRSPKGNFFKNWAWSADSVFQIIHCFFLPQIWFLAGRVNGNKGNRLMLLDEIRHMYKKYDLQ